MLPREIEGNYKCAVRVLDYHIAEKTEYRVSVKIDFRSRKTETMASTTWHVSRTFSSFRGLDEDLRRRNPVHMKGIKFPSRHWEKNVLRTHKSTGFLDRRLQALDTYIHKSESLTRDIRNEGSASASSIFSHRCPYRSRRSSSEPKRKVERV